MDYNYETIEVDTPAGSKFQVLNEVEKDYFEDVAVRYLSDNHFTNITDLQDLDSILTKELMCYRWSLWLSQEADYEGNAINLQDLQKSIKEYATEIRLTKKAMGIDKNSRDKEKSASVAEYLEQLRNRAKEFGIIRNEQSVKLLTLGMELISLIQFHDNCDEIERREQNIEEHDFIEWIREVFVPEFKMIDEKFRETSQKYWIEEV